MVVRQGERKLSGVLWSGLSLPWTWTLRLWPSQVSLGVFLPFWVGKDGQSLLVLVISLPAGQSDSDDTLAGWVNESPLSTGLIKNKSSGLFQNGSSPLSDKRPWEFFLTIYCETLVWLLERILTVLAHSPTPCLDPLALCILHLLWFTSHSPPSSRCWSLTVPWSESCSPEQQLCIHMLL